MILSNEEILELVPQQYPFRFIDKIHYVDDTTIKCSFRFDQNLDFYKGHFPGNPITPGVILIEACAQMSSVSHGIWLYAKECETKQQISEYVTFFSGLENAEFIKPVLPGEEVFVEGKLLVWKRKRIKHETIMKNSKGEIVMSCMFSGFGVKK
jgi:3-hydroxyacyl-[acyl-carrier-protein] dehydratase